MEAAQVHRSRPRVSMAGRGPVARRVTIGLTVLTASLIVIAAWKGRYHFVNVTFAKLFPVGYSQADGNTRFLSNKYFAHTASKPCSHFARPVPKKTESNRKCCRPAASSSFES